MDCERSQILQDITVRLDIVNCTKIMNLDSIPYGHGTESQLTTWWT